MLARRQPLMCLCIGLLTLLFARQALPQSQQFIAKHTPDFFQQMQGFSAIEKNLIDMTKSASPKESFALTQLFYFTSNLNNASQELWTIAMIYQRLRDQRDVKEVVQILATECVRLKNHAKITVEQLNSRLVLMNSQAIIAELTKAREATQKLAGHEICH